MNSRFLNVLHHATDIQARAVIECVHIDLHRIVQEAIDEQRCVWPHDGEFTNAVKIALERFGIINNLHPTSTEDITGTDQDRKANVLGDC